MTKKFYAPLAVLLLCLLIFSNGCATKNFVLEEIDKVNAEIANLRTEMGEQKAEIMKTVNEDVKNTIRRETRGQLTELLRTPEIQEQIKEISAKKLVHSVSFSSEQATFSLGKAGLTDQAKAVLDDIFNRLVRDNKDVYIEIHGHTCSLGTRAWNKELGLMRAEAVKAYAAKQYNIPLHRIDTISHGPDSPIADNQTEAGRRQNRRVVIKVLQ